MSGISRRDSLRYLFGGAAAVGSIGSSLFSRSVMAAVIAPGSDSVLIVVDVQNCFVPGGTLPVKDGDAVIPIINALGKHFENVVLTQDWHTKHHASFATTYKGKKPFETTELSYGTQVLWPDHCVQGTEDAELVPSLDIPNAELIIRKGFHSSIDSYSAFMEADHTTKTGLKGYLNERNIRKVYVTGLATDFCVAWTAMDAVKSGFEAYVIEDATRAIDLNGSLAAAWDAMAKAGVKRIKSSDIL